MNCPYCGRPAEDGYIYCGHKSGSILWYPEGADYAVIYTKKNIARHGGVELVKSSSMFDEAATMNVSLSVSYTHLDVYKRQAQARPCS